jgi:restriction endonuclease S subunit
MKEGWEYKKLGEVCETSSGGTPSKSKKEFYEGGNIPWLRSGEVAQGLIYKSELFITEKGLNNSSAKLFPIDTIVLAMYGATVGQVGLLKKEMATNQAICGIFPNKSFIPMFLLYSLRAKKPFFMKDAVGGAQPNISQNLIKKTLVPIPPLSEQQRIVEELNLLSSIIGKKKEQLKELDNLAQSIFYDMFGDPVTNEKGWEVKKLGDICEYAKTRIDSKDISVNNYIGVDNLLQNCQGKTSASKVPEGLKLTKYIEGDVLIGNIRPYLKKIWLADAVGGCNGDVLTIRRITQYTNCIDVMYIFKCLSTNMFFDYTMQFAKGEKMPRGDKKEIMKYPIPLPPLSLQQQFASKIEAIERQKELIKQSIKEVETLFSSRMDYYFN